MSSQPPQPTNRERLWFRFVVLIGAIVLLVVVARHFGLAESFDRMKVWIATLGAYGPLAFIAVYTLGVVLALPGSALTAAGGALFGSLWGVVWVITGATLGASLAFLIARYAARDLIRSRLAGNSRFEQLDSLTRKHGAIVVAITRLVPLFPFNVLNYGFGLTAVPFTTYVLWSALCMLPGTILYVVGTDALIQAIQSGRVPWFLIAICVVVFALLALLVQKARRKIKE